MHYEQTHDDFGVKKTMNGAAAVVPLPSSASQNNEYSDCSTTGGTRVTNGL